MKKILAALLLTATVAGAASANMTGFYVGVGGITGATTANYSDRADSIPAAGAAAAGAYQNNQGGRTNWGGRLEAGYGMTFAGCGWWGVSVYASLLNTKVKLSGAEGSPTLRYLMPRAELKNSYNYGIEFKLGYHFSKDTVGFVGIAAEAAQYKLSWTETNFTASGASATSTGPFVFMPTLTAKKTKVYAKPVLGVRTTGIGGNRNLFLEAKYGYGFSNRITLKAPATANGNFTTTARTITARPRTHEFSVTIGWRF